MNPFTALNDTAKLVLTGIALVAVLAALLFVYSLFGARAELKAVKAGDARIAKGAKADATVAKKRDAASAEFFKRNAADSQVLEKVLSHDEADFDDASRDEYHRVLNNALRGPQR